MWCRICKFLSKFILAGTLILLIFLGLDNFTTQPALASIREMQEAPGQKLIQSRHTFKDEKGISWQIVLFKRFFADDSSIINLRLVDFSGLAELVHPQALEITTDTRDVFKAEDLFAEKSPAANVGEFDVKNILSQLPITRLNLSFAIKDRSIELSIPPEVLLEWQSVAAQS